jgi:hypothetical protein
MGQIDFLTHVPFLDESVYRYAYSPFLEALLNKA